MNQTVGQWNRVLLRCSASKCTADHAQATGQPWRLLVRHSETFSRAESYLQIICQIVALTIFNISLSELQ